MPADYSLAAAYPVIQRLVAGELDAQLSPGGRRRHLALLAQAEALQDPELRKTLLGALAGHIHQDMAHVRAQERSELLSAALKRERPAEHAMLEFVHLVQTQQAVAKRNLERVRKELQAAGNPASGNIFWLEHEHAVNVEILRNKVEALLLVLRGANSAEEDGV